MQAASREERRRANIWSFITHLRVAPTQTEEPHLLIFANSLVVFHNHINAGGGVQRRSLQVELQHLRQESAKGIGGVQRGPASSEQSLSAIRVKSTCLNMRLSSCEWLELPRSKQGSPRCQSPLSSSFHLKGRAGALEWTRSSQGAFSHREHAAAATANTAITYHHFSLCTFGLSANFQQHLCQSLGGREGGCRELLSLQGMRGKMEAAPAAGDDDDDDDDNRRKTAGRSVADW